MFMTLLETAEEKSARLKKDKELRSAKKVLCVDLEKCEGLKGTDSVGKSDPYVQLVLRRNNGTVVSARTETKGGVTDPSFGEVFEFNVDMSEVTKGINTA